MTQSKTHPVNTDASHRGNSLADYHDRMKPCPPSILEKLAVEKTEKTKKRSPKQSTATGQATALRRSASRVKIPADVIRRLLFACWKDAEPFSERGQFLGLIFAVKDANDGDEALQAVLDFGKTDKQFDNAVAIDGNRAMWESGQQSEDRGGEAVSYASLLKMATDQIRRTELSLAFDDDADPAELSRFEEAKDALVDAKVWADRDEFVCTDDPVRLANVVLEEHGRLWIRFFRDEFHLYCAQTGAYRPLSDAEIDSMIGESVHSEFQRVLVDELKQWRKAGDAKKAKPKAKRLTRTVVQDAKAALAGLTLIRTPDETTESPFWLSGSHAVPGTVALPFRNGSLDLTELRNGKVTLRAHSPQYFCTTAIPYELDTEAQCPQFLKMLKRATGDDTELIMSLAEAFGSAFWPTNEFHRLFMAIGTGGTGKSALRAALQAMAGESNCFPMQLERFGDQFGLQGLQDKLAIIVEELSDPDTAEEGVLKALTSGAPMRADRKFKAPISVTVGGKLFCFVNQRPRFRDLTTGIWRRVLHFPFDRPVSEEEIVRGMDKPEFWHSERSGIAAWAIRGLIRLLRNNGSFTIAPASAAALEQHRRDCNPAESFFEEFVELTDAVEHWVECRQLYDRYREFCFDGGNKPLDNARFGQMVHRRFAGNLSPSEFRTRTRRHGCRLYVYRGLFLTTPEFDDDGVDSPTNDQIGAAV